MSRSDVADHAVLVVSIRAIHLIKLDSLLVPEYWT